MKTTEDTPIKTARLKAGYSQIELARLVEVSLPTITQWERGVMHPRPENRRRLEDVLGIRLGGAEE